MRGYTGRYLFGCCTYLWFMQVGGSRDCATSTTSPVDYDASSVTGRSDGLKKVEVNAVRAVPSALAWRVEPDRDEKRAEWKAGLRRPAS